MARRKIEVSAQEMLELRKQGFSNKDIANMLEISLATVIRYIGNQNKRMVSLTSFAEKPKKEKPKEEPAIKVISQTVAAHGWCIKVNMADKSIELDVQASYGIGLTPSGLSLTSDEARRLSMAIQEVQKQFAD